MLEDLTFRFGEWTLHLAIAIDGLKNIPERTEWYVILPRNYPYGEILIFPSKINGLTETYPHQAYNGPGVKDCPWTTGDPCLRTGLRSLGRRDYDDEPMSIELRLAWHVWRLKVWLKNADGGNLLKTDDPFELPSYPNTSRTEYLGFMGGLGQIGELPEESWTKKGSAIMHRIVGEKGTRVWMPVKFKNVRGEIIPGQTGTMLHGREKGEFFAIWVRVSCVPHLTPWKGIRTYGELRQYLRAEDLDFDELILRFGDLLRDGFRHVLLIGFPAPEKVGGRQGSWYWLGLLLPILAHGPIKGFRQMNQSYLAYDREHVLADCKELEWMQSRSWHPKDILNRGRFNMEFTAKKVLVIGLGAVGAFVSELLVRAGVKSLVLVDDERLEVGNLSRHTLTLKEVGEYKVEAVARRLKLAEPQVDVEELSCSLHDANERFPETITRSDLIIDCTGDDALLYDLAGIQFDKPKLFSSISLGFGAKQGFVFCTKAPQFPAGEFKSRVTPFLEKERKEMENCELPRDGIGCWHPAFPARCDDVWLLTSAAIKIVDAFVQGEASALGLTVLRQKVVDGVFCGIEKVDEP